MSNPSTDERRRYPRSARALPLTIHQPDDPFLLGPGIGNVRTADVGAGGVYFKVFEPIPFRCGDRVALRFLVPAAGDGDEATPVSILAPSVSGVGTVLRIDRVFVHGVAGRGVAVRFDGPLEVDEPHGLTAATAVR